MKCTLLIDCDSFYASCEKIFRPDLKDKPVVVLSNNDGFIIAKSKEAKKLGFDLLEPYFKVEDKLKKYNVTVFSANFELYGDISARVMSILETFASKVEVYSIDEAFIDLDESDPVGVARAIRQTIWKHVGVPVSIGIATTKTLAKVATKVAKKNSEHDGVFSLLDKDADAFLEKMDVQDIWGVGYRSAEFLRSKGVLTAKDFKNAPEKWVKDHMSVTGLRCQKELKGVRCFSLDDTPSPQRSILTSRSFGRLVETLYDLSEAVAAYTTRACEKLRKQQSLCSCVSVFINTSPHGRNPHYSNFASHRLVMPSADTSELIRIARNLTRKIYRPGYRYIRVGIVLTDLVSENNAPEYLFVTPYQRSRERTLMNTVDKINQLMGPGTIKFGSVGLSGKPWKARQASRSPRYTSRWSELRKIKV